MPEIFFCPFFEPIEKQLPQVYLKAPTRKPRVEGLDPVDLTPLACQKRCRTRKTAREKSIAQAIDVAEKSFVEVSAAAARKLQELETAVGRGGAVRNGAVCVYLLRSRVCHGRVIALSATNFPRKKTACWVIFEGFVACPVERVVPLPPQTPRQQQAPAPPPQTLPRRRNRSPSVARSPSPPRPQPKSSRARLNTEPMMTPATPIVGNTMGCKALRRARLMNGDQ